jgi:thiol-disulfide isomerase/thioredoxin
MKKSLPYIAVVVVLLIAAGIYVQKTDKNVPVLSADIGLFEKENKPETEPATPPESRFRNYGPAPELAGITKWYNSDPLTLANLKGKVVLVNFWNYSSINSVKAYPYLTKWNDSYKDQGLVIIGVHTPEFAFEKVNANLENAMKAHSVNYPVAQDNNYKTWTAYHNQFWPAYYLVDKDGNLVYTHFGEGNYDDMEKSLKILLGLEGEYVTPPLAESNQAKTEEMQLGLARQTQYGGTDKITSGNQIYTFPKKLGTNKFALEGLWSFNQEAAIHSNGFAKIKLNFDAAKVFLVAEAEKPTTIRIYIDGTLIKGVVVRESDLYPLFDSLVGGQHTMEIEIPSGEFKAFTFTFG